MPPRPVPAFTPQYLIDIHTGLQKLHPAFRFKPSGSDLVGILLYFISEGNDTTSNPALSSVPVHLHLHRIAQFPWRITVPELELGTRDETEWTRNVFYLITKEPPLLNFPDGSHWAPQENMSPILSDEVEGEQIGWRISYGLLGWVMRVYTVMDANEPTRLVNFFYDELNDDDNF